MDHLNTSNTSITSTLIIHMKLPKEEDEKMVDLDTNRCEQTLANGLLISQTASVAPQVMPQNGGSGPAGIHQQQQLHQLALQSYSHLSQVLPQQTQALQARGELCYWYHPEDSHSDRCLPCGDRVAAVIPSETLAPAALKDDGLVSDLVILLAGVYGFFLSDIALGFYGGLETSLAETSIIYQTAQSAIVPTAGDLQASVAAVEARVGLLENPGDAIV
ncbi:hypothetical protein C5167_028382 [Papaver somniferum]|nr:hypothetical protein C5167_028382 [Papaver somniferum]